MDHNIEQNNILRSFFYKWHKLILIMSSVFFILSIIFVKIKFPTFFQSEHTFSSDASSENAIMDVDDITESATILLTNPYICQLFSSSFLATLQEHISESENYNPYTAFLNDINTNKKIKLNPQEAEDILALYLNRKVSKIVSREISEPWYGFLFLIKNVQASGWSVTVRVSEKKYGDIYLLAAFKALDKSIDAFNEFRIKNIHNENAKSINIANANLKLANKSYQAGKGHYEKSIMQIHRRVAELESNIYKLEKKYKISSNENSLLSENSYFQVAKLLANINSNKVEKKGDIELNATDTMETFKFNSLAMRLAKISTSNANIDTQKYFRDLSEITSMYSENFDKYKILFSQFHSSRNRVLTLIKKDSKPLDLSKLLLGNPIINENILFSMKKLDLVDQAQSLLVVLAVIGLILGVLAGFIIALILEVFGVSFLSSMKQNLV